MTGLPLDFRKWLVTVGTHEVTSHLNLLFIENGVPLTQDYITALSNYNLRTETDILREWAHQQVRNLVIELLFNKLSDTSNHVASFIHKYCDNISNSLLKEEACRLIHNTVQVSSLDVTVPRTKIMTTVYNLYIHPPNLLEAIHSGAEVLCRNLWRQSKVPIPLAMLQLQIDQPPSRPLPPCQKHEGEKRNHQWGTPT